MKKIIILSFITLDGVMQAPGGPTEDTRGNFTLGGWTVPFFDEALGEIMGAQMGDQMETNLGRPFDLLLGRRTFEIFTTYWPTNEGGDNPINHAVKYVASNTLTSHPWQKTVFLKGDVPAQVRHMKQQDGPDLQVHGSGDFIQTLLKHDLVDELWLKIFPVTLGMGQRLFAGGTLPASFSLVDVKTTPSGVIVANFKRAGDVVTGSY
jgi:dihydrofolate reductase